MSIIINNFVKYLTESFEKVFAETVLLGLRGCGEQQADHLQTTVKSRDFKTALNTMGEVTFQVDLSFAIVMKSLLDKKEFAA